MRPTKALIRTATKAAQAKMTARLKAMRNQPRNKLSEAITSLAAALRIVGDLLKDDPNTFEELRDGGDDAAVALGRDCADAMIQTLSLGKELLGGATRSQAAPAAPTAAPAAASNTLTSREYGRLPDAKRREFLRAGGQIV